MNEGPASFQAGQKSGTDFHNGVLRLDPDPACLGNWTRQTDGVPSSRSEHAMVFDSQAGLAVLYGGLHGWSTGDRETWTYNKSANSWALKSFISPPGPRYSHAMVYDSSNQVVILFGGFNSNTGIAGDTWTYNVSTNTWKEMKPSPAPPARYDHSMAFDSKNGVAVLFGGYNNQRLFNDTWTYDFKSNSWTNRTGATAPPARQGHGLAYDSAAGLSVLFGGANYSGSLSDTWVYDGATSVWSNRGPGSSPPQMQGHAMAFDVSAGVTVLFGGTQTWEMDQIWTYSYSANSWAARAPASKPAAREDPTLIYDSLAGACLLFGGTNGEHLDTDGNWFYFAGNSTWVLFKCLLPSSGAEMVYDSWNRQMVLFGGSPSDNSVNAETWTYDLVADKWTRREPGLAPPARARSAMAYDSANRLVVLFGGYFDPNTLYNDTWVYDPATNVWTERTPPVSPSVRTGHRMVYDSRNGVMVMFGGDYLTPKGYETWIYNVSADRWTLRFPSLHPSARTMQSMAYDVAAGVVLLFGGYTGWVSTETWAYNVSQDSWTDLNPIPRPSHGQQGAMAYDPGDRLTLYFGGTYLDGQPSSETWAYDSATNKWSQRNPPQEPPGRTNPAAAYDSAAHSFMIFGGANGSQPNYQIIISDTWIYDLKVYPSSGTYQSLAKDLKGCPRFGPIWWNCSIPGGTWLGFQLRTANTSAGLASLPFIGPDGTNASYYLVSGARISAIHNDRQWFQYQAVLKTGKPRETPLLFNVTIDYNLLQSVNITSPKGGERWCKSHNITWKASDPDGDSLIIDIYLVSSAPTVHLARLTEGEDRWTWDTTATPEGGYRIMIAASDTNRQIPLKVNATSGPLTVYWNHPPEINLTSPPDKASIPTTEVDLCWSGMDENGDPLNYTLFCSASRFDADTLPEPEAVFDGTTYRAFSLTDGRTYYWAVRGNDGIEDGALSEVRSFTVKLPGPNRPPWATLKAPPEGAVLNRTDVNLSWEGGDPDGDDVTYSVHILANNFTNRTRPPAVATAAGGHIVLTDLVNGTTYYWSVLPFDGKSYGTLPAVQSFKVDVSLGNHLPTITSAPPTNATVGREYTYPVAAFDEDGDTLNYSLVKGPRGFDIDSATGRIAWIPGTDQAGVHTMRVRVTDSRGGWAEQEFRVTVTLDEPVDFRPKCSITAPKTNSTVSKAVAISGIAEPGSAPLVKVQLSVDRGPWADARGTANWTFSLDTTKLKNGNHTIAARAFDGANYSDADTIALVVKNARPVSKGFIPGFEAGIAFCAIALLLPRWAAKKKPNTR